jgi:hypothetical protein
MRSSWLLLGFFARPGWTTLPRQLAWSSKTYGPDGPWHAISIDLGSNSQPLDLYPGNTWHSNILASSICSGVLTCYAQEAGLYDASASTSVSTYTIINEIETIDWTAGAMPMTGNHSVQFDTATIIAVDLVAQDAAKIPDLSLQVILYGYYTLPNGTKYLPEVGTLALGAEGINQSYPSVGSITNFNASLISGYLYETDQIASNSYGLHIGSAALGIPGSAFVGGYDQSRVLGEVTAQSYALYSLPIDLLDIGIGVAEGASPFTYPSKSGLLAQGNSSIGVALPVLIEATIPYLYLPGSTCDAIASQLPVTFQPDYGLYFWNTADLQYTRIVTSPAYLSFTFRLNRSDSQNMTINVPFKLLNLTLEEPLAHTPTQYFPCRPLTDGGSYTLGRAFLQAAFVGVNWQSDLNGLWFLAQAPGPNTPSTAVVTPIGFSDTSINSSSNQWIDSWKGSWTVLDEPSSSSNTTSTGSDASPSATSTSNNLGTKGAASGVSHSAIAGIVLGCVAVALGLLSFFLIRRRKRRSTPALVAPVDCYELNNQYSPVATTPAWAELGHSNNATVSELEHRHGQSRMELAASPVAISREPNFAAELQGSRF